MYNWFIYWIPKPAFTLLFVLLALVLSVIAFGLKNRIKPLHYRASKLMVVIAVFSFTAYINAWFGAKDSLVHVCELLIGSAGFICWILFTLPEPVIQPCIHATFGEQSEN